MEEGGSWVVDKLADLDLPADIPTIIHGNWNIKHPNWCMMPEYQLYPSCQAKDFVEWINLRGFVLQNPFNATTHITPNSTTELALDLTFVNATAADMRLVHNWRIDSNLSGTSDHFAILFSVGRCGEEILNPSQARFNWRGADQTEFCEKLMEARGVNEWKTTFEPIKPNNPLCTPTYEEIDKAFELIMTKTTEAAKATVPRRKVLRWSVPWFNGKPKAALIQW